MPAEWAVILPPGTTATTYHLADCTTPIVVASHILTNLAEAAQALERAGMPVSLIELLETSRPAARTELAEVVALPADAPGQPIDASLLCICGYGFSHASKLEEHKRTCGVYARGGPRIPEFPGEGG